MGDPAQADAVAADLREGLPNDVAGATASLLVRPIKTGELMSSEAMVVDGVTEATDGGSASLAAETAGESRAGATTTDAFSAAVRELAPGDTAFANPDGSPRLTPEQQRTFDEVVGESTPR